MPALLWLAASFYAGYRAGRYATRWQVTTALRREASALLDSLGRLSMNGGLASIEGLRLRQGSDENNVQLIVKTREGGGFDWDTFLGLDESSGLGTHRG